MATWQAGKLPPALASTGSLHATAGFWHALGVAGGVVVVVVVTADIVRALVVPRAGHSRLGRVVETLVDGLFQMISRPISDYERKDRVLAFQAPVSLLVRLVVWLAGFELGYALLLWPAVANMPRALEETASSMFTLGFVYSRGGTPTAVDVLAAATGLFVVALQIAFLPTLYGAFNRRETEVTLLASRAGTPPWGPELLARTRYGGADWTDDLPELYVLWERWAADVAESHANYPSLVRFRSPQPLSSWVVALLAVMDSAAMWLAVSPSRERREARLALRMGFTAMREVGKALGLPMEAFPDPDPDSDIKLRFEEFESAVEGLVAVGFPVERSATEAWPHFRGWRVNYETLAYALAKETDAVPAPWSGPRRWPAKTINVRRPASRLPKETGGFLGHPLQPPRPASPDAPLPPEKPPDSVASKSAP